MGKEAVVVERGRAEAADVMGVEVRFLCTGERTGREWSLIECSVPKDAGPPPHEHAWDEAYYIVAGQARFTIGDRELIAQAGDFLYAPGGTVHSFQGAGDEPARLLVFDAPAAAEAFFREAAAEVRNVPQDFAKVPGIGARHGIRFVPPAAG
jgi:quercetin dioxygenase-like cupin family protein